jgi:hypothetical protein
MDDQSHRIAVCHRQSPDEEDQRCWFPKRRFDDGVQAAAVRRGAWLRVNASHLVVLVRAGVQFPDGQTQMLQVDPSEDVKSRT